MKQFRWLGVVMTATILSILASSADSQNSEYSLEILPSVALTRFGDRQGIGSHTMFGGMVQLVLTDALRVGLSFDTGNPVINFDLVGTKGSEPVHVHLYQAVVSYHVATFFSDLTFSALATGGLVHLSTDEKLIAAGDFGFIKVPGKTEQSAIVSVGIVGSKKLVSRLSAFVYSRLLYVSPLELTSPGYSIGGGLSIGIL